MPLGSMGAVQVTSALRASMLLIRGGSILVGSEEIKHKYFTVIQKCTFSAK